MLVPVLRLAPVLVALLILAVLLAPVGRLVLAVLLVPVVLLAPVN